MTTVDILKALAATSSRNDKEQMLFKAYMEGERDLFIGARLALDPLTSFGVKKVAEIMERDDTPNNLPFVDFLKLAHRLRRRELTGHAARDAIIAAAERTDFDTWNLFYRRILLKDFKCGVDSSTINKVLTKKIVQTNPEAKDFLIPIWSPQLATDGADDEGVFLPKYRKGVKLLDVKFDGVRLVTILDVSAKTVTQYTREGRVNENFPHIVAALEGLLPHLPGSIVIDGEITANSFQELMEQLNTKEAASNTTKLAAFDIIPLADFMATECKVSQRERHEMLVALCTSDKFREIVGDHVYALPKVEVDLDTEEGNAAFEEFLRQTGEMAKTDQKIEGVMVKDPEAPYRSNGSNSWVRTKAWLKIKPVISVTLTCTGMEPGKPDGRHAHTLGGLVLEGEDAGKKIRVVCGGGLSDAQRNEFWNDPYNTVIGYLFEVEADKLTKPKKGDVWSLRFPRLKGRRGTMPGEKL
jgi:DNA ligase 1